MEVSVTDAKGQLTDLVRRAEAGEEVVLTRHGLRLDDLDPVARRELLGADLDDLLHGPVRRIGARDLLSHLERIEGL